MIRASLFFALLCACSGDSSGTPDAGDASTGNDASSGNDAATGDASSSDASDASTTATRPSYNTGPGFFVLNGKLYDANGNEFRMRGVNRNHYDSASAAGLAKSHANTVRAFVETNYGATWAQLASMVQNDLVANKIVPIITAPSTTSGTGTSCNTATATLTDVVTNSWVATVSTWKAFDKYSLVNIANEWGPSNSTAWRDAYVSAVGAMRTAGYLGAFLVDAGGCGQDLDDLATYSKAIIDADPQHNVVFALHLYGSVNDFQAQVASIKKGTTTVVTLTGTSTCHPFAPTYCPALGKNNTFSGITSYSLSGVQGMTQINGIQAAPQNVGGTSGAWTITLNVDSSSFGAYTSGGTVVDGAGNVGLRIAKLGTLPAQTGAAYAITEFGPGRNIGPSPTLVTPLEIITAAEQAGLGWLAWAWDDNNQNGGQTDNEWFGLTYKGPGTYTKDADLTMFGQQIVLGCTNPAPGGCGCPDGTPLPAYYDPNNPSAPPPAVYQAVEPACTGTLAPTYQPLSLALAKTATIY